LNNAFSNELGGQLGATLRYDLSDHMYIGAGIEYVRTENRFDYLLLRDTMIGRPTIELESTRSRCGLRRILFYTPQSKWKNFIFKE